LFFTGINLKVKGLISGPTAVSKRLNVFQFNVSSTRILTPYISSQNGRKEKIYKTTQATI